MFSRSRHLIFTAGTLANQLIGYFFIRTLAQRYGTSPEKAGFDIAYSVPFVIMSLTGLFFLQGILTAHFAGRSKQQLSQDVSTIVALLVLFSAVGALCCSVGSTPLAALLAPGFSVPEQRLIADLLLSFLPLMFAYGIFTVFSAALISLEIPIEADLCSLCSRAPVLLLLLALPDALSLQQIAWSLSAASFLSLLLGGYLLHCQLALPFSRPQLPLSKELRQVLSRSGGFIIAAVLAQLAFAVMRGALSLDSTAAVAAYGYAMMVLAPLSLLLGKPIAYAFGPRFIAQTALTTNHRREILGKIIGYSLAVTCLATAGCLLFADTIVVLLFSGGAFDSTSVALTSSILRLLTLALPALVLMWVLLFPLLGVTGKIPAHRVYSVGSILQLIACLIGYWLWGAKGTCLGYVLAMYGQLLFGLRLVGWQALQKASA